MLFFSVLLSASPDVQATSPWQVEDCAAVRHLAGAPQPADLHLVVEPLSDRANLSLKLTALKGATNYGTGDDGAAILNPSGDRVSAKWRRLTNNEGSALTLVLPRGKLAHIGAAESLRMEIAGKVIATVPVNGIATVLPLIQACIDARMKAYGLDPAEDDALAGGSDAPQPIGDVAKLLSPTAYPEEALRAGRQGTVVLTWTVTPEGRAKSCRILESSGFGPLDQGTCALVLSRARYQPSATGGHAMTKVRWALPGVPG